jgi:AhpD family alkylhydroperoxidase
MKQTPDPEIVRQTIREGYGQIAVAGSPRRSSGGSCCGPTASSCGSTPVGSEQLARHIGYSAEELAALPEGANMGLSCGNPNALASLQPGEVVLDLGSGGGFDVFIAGKKVGPKGRAIGVDMTAEMLAKARKNVESYRQTTGLDNVEFRLGEIEHLPVADASVDAIISNCVINLSPDKPQVWREMSRVLKPGGRVAVSDLALLKPLPPAILEMVEALVGCVAGAVLVSETEGLAKAAGLTDLVLRPKPGYIDGMVDWQDPLYQKIIANLPAGTKPGDYITSLEISARKPGAAQGAKPAKRLEVYDPALCCSTGIYSPAVNELVAIGAAIAANCEPCLKYHYREAEQLGMSKADMARAVEMGAKVKDSPHQAILKLADRLTGATLSKPSAEPDACCGAQPTPDAPASGKCCG